MTDERGLDERLTAAGVAAGTAPVAVWRRLHEVEGPRATVIDLYELAARPRGLAGPPVAVHRAGGPLPCGHARRVAGLDTDDGK